MHPGDFDPRVSCILVMWKLQFQAQALCGANFVLHLDFLYYCGRELCVKLLNAEEGNDEKEDTDISNSKPKSLRSFQNRDRRTTWPLLILIRMALVLLQVGSTDDTRELAKWEDHKEV
ncbi:hypothetical protein C5167_013974 [Papaver somniferum]|uniref:Uncharacterized protein n=1 Tax=Papaver somniferum TaxID=3469 RepID=A0A4Y7J5W7_PAPSO|nr:hypothetical protein C5167_013974 [Papaver somniferum]